MYVKRAKNLAQVSSKNVLFTGKEIYPPVDSIFNSIGDFGKWQLRISLLMAFLKLPIAWFQLGNILIAPKTDFNCIKPNYIQNVSNTEWRSLYSENLTNHLVRSLILA